MVESDDRARLTVQSSFGRVNLGAELDPCHITDPNGAAILLLAEHDVAKLCRRDQLSFCDRHITEFLARRNGLAAGLPDRIDRVLLLNRADDVRDGYVKSRKLIGFNPDTNRVLARAKDLHIGNAGNPCELIIQVDHRVVCQKRRIVTSVCRTEGEKHQGSGKGFLNTDPLRRHFGRQLGRCLRLAHLRKDLVGLRVCRFVKVHPQLHLPAVRVEGVHVVHVVNTADLLFDRR